MSNGSGPIVIALSHYDKPGSETSRLLAAARGGDHVALDDLYARHQGRLLNFLRASIAQSSLQAVTAEDVLQETLIASARKIAEFEPSGPASFYRWLVSIARFKLTEAGRAQKAKKRATAPLEEPVAASQTSPSGRLLRGERRDGLLEALANLPNRQADAVRMRYLEGQSVAEVAEQLACSDSAVKALVSRAMAELASRLGQNF